VSVKYIAFVMRADNKGEGGILALTALVQRAMASVAARSTLLVSLGVLGAALFYGDSVITPAISVLSAVEGLKVAAPGLSHLAMPLALVLLTGPLRHPALGHRRRRARVRACHGPLVRGHRRDRRA
jgi:KUP system potassium uptake protein